MSTSILTATQKLQATDLEGRPVHPHPVQSVTGAPFSLDERDLALSNKSSAFVRMHLFQPTHLAKESGIRRPPGLLEGTRRRPEEERGVPGEEQ